MFKLGDIIITESGFYIGVVYSIDSDFFRVRYIRKDRSLYHDTIRYNINKPESYNNWMLAEDYV